MDFEFSEAQQQFRSELEGFLAETLPSWWHERDQWESWNEDVRAFETTLRVCSGMAERGWLVMQWPEEYGGRDATIWEQIIMREVMWSHDEPRGQQYMSANWVGPAIMAFGTEEQKAEHLPRIAAGRSLWCQGFSEPDAGSDLASLQTRARRDGDCYVVNGEKIWTSHTPHAEWCFLTVRTDPDAPKHRGITVLLVPLSTPGITVRQIRSMAGLGAFASVSFEDVKVPVSARLGEENRGWYVMAEALNFERIGAPRYMKSLRHLEELARKSSATMRNGTRLSDDASFRRRLAELRIDHEVARLLYYLAASFAAKGEDFSFAASLGRIASTVCNQDVADFRFEIAGASAQVVGNAESPADEWIDSIPATIAAGTLEVQHNIIATRGLGLPR